jgi:hypothetical protein
MRQGILAYRVLESIVDRDAPDLRLQDVKAAAMPIVTRKAQLAKVLSRLIHDGYLSKTVHVANRARRIFGREEILR